MAEAKFPDTRILVVDDSEFSRRSIVSILEEHQFNVVGDAGNAKQAIELSSSTNANLFIIDVVMPDYSGIELAKFFHDKLLVSYIVMISSLSEESVIMDSIGAGVSDFLQKPFSPDDLMNSVLKLARKIKEEVSG